MKTFLRILFGAAAVGLLAAGITALYADRIARGAVERGASEALGVETDVRRADLGLLTDASSLDGIRVRNPERFESERFLAADRVALELDLFDLLEEEVRVHRLVLRDLDIHLERRGEHTNYDVILENLRRYRRGRPAAEAKRFVFDVVTIRNLAVHVNLLPEAGEIAKLEVEIPELTLRNVGSGRDGGAVIGQVTDELVTAVLRAAMEKARQELPDRWSEELTPDFVERLRRFGEDLEERMRDRAKEILRGPSRPPEHDGDAVR